MTKRYKRRGAWVTLSVEHLLSWFQLRSWTQGGEIKPHVSGSVLSAGVCLRFSLYFSLTFFLPWCPSPHSCTLCLKKKKKKIQKEKKLSNLNMSNIDCFLQLYWDKTDIITLCSFRCAHLHPSAIPITPWKRPINYFHELIFCEFFEISHISDII